MKEKNEVTSTPKKKHTGLIIFICIICLVLGAVGGVILGDYFFDKTNKIEEKLTVDKKEGNANIELNVADEDTMMKIANLVFYDSDNFKFNDLDNQEKLDIAISLSGKNITELSGKEITSIIEKYFGKNAKIALEDIDCEMKHDNSSEQAMYIYSKETDKYVYNDKHPGHGASTNKTVTPYIYKNKVSIKDDKYILTVDAYYTENSCTSDVCPTGVFNENIYKTYKDAENKTNSLFDATKDSNYCSVSTLDEKLYECNYEKIYNDIKDKLSTYTFEFTKVNNNLVFEKYYINKAHLKR